MRRLEDEGIIRGYTIRETGIGLSALVRLSVGPGIEIGTLAGEYASWDGIESVYEISGDADLIVLAHVDDTVALLTLGQNLVKCPGKHNLNKNRACT